MGDAFYAQGKVASRQKGNPKKSFKQRGKWIPLENELQRLEPPPHPALEYEDTSSGNLMCLGRGVLLDLLDTIGTQSPLRMWTLAQTSCTVVDAVRSSKGIWKKAIERDFSWRKPWQGVSPCYEYQFLCCYENMDKMYIINDLTTRALADDLPVLPLNFMKVEFTCRGLEASLYLSSQDGIWGIPFLVATLINHPSLVKLRVQEAAGVSEEARKNFFSVQDWQEGECSFPELMSCGSSFLLTMQELIQTSHLIPIQKFSENLLDSKYLMADGSWPQCFPKPGLYHCLATGVQIRLFISPHQMHITKLLSEHDSLFGQDFSLHVASVTTMPAREQQELCLQDYIAYETGLEGNPKAITRNSPLQLPAEFRDVFPGVVDYRAMYCQVPAEDPNPMTSRKIIVWDENFFMILYHEQACAFKRSILF